MTTKVAVALAGSIALSVGTAMLAAPGQAPPPGTERPGQIARGQVFIENRGRNEAIPIVAPEPVPVVVQNAAGSPPMPVRLSGNSPGSPPSPIAVRHASQAWEFRTVSVPADLAPQGLTNILAGPGNEGWEPAGVQMTSGTNTLVVLKRPKS
jgi:hypothetical protein